MPLLSPALETAVMSNNTESIADAQDSPFVRDVICEAFRRAEMGGRWLPTRASDFPPSVSAEDVEGTYKPMVLREVNSRPTRVDRVQPVIIASFLGDMPIPAGDVAWRSTQPSDGDLVAALFPLAPL